MKKNLCFDLSVMDDTDSYKVTHHKQYPENTTSVFSYIESRGGKYDETVFFGLQYYLKRYLQRKITRGQVAKTAKFMNEHVGHFNKKGWLHIVKDHGGRLPLRIRAVPEGTVVPTHNILCSVENTCPKCFWLTSYIETMLLRIWYPINVATLSREIKKIIYAGLLESCENPDNEILFRLHDFGSRGVSSQESAMIGGMGHLVNFMGSDTVAAVIAAREYYDSHMAAFSIPAAEHSTITSWKRENEVASMRNMLKQFAAPGKIVAVVSDSYDIYNACEHLWGEELKDEVIQSGATIVVRPDSGDPVIVVVKCLELLESKFGSVINKKGFKILNNVRVIQGDGINAEFIKEIVKAALVAGFSVENVAFGMGGALLQQHNRDTQKFAMKCSAITANGEEIEVYKDPITDKGKASKKGRLDLIEDFDGKFEKLVTVQLPPGHSSSLTTVMNTVFENGKILVETNFKEVRARAKL